MTAVAILGAGSWGTSLAVVLAPHEPVLWDHDEARAVALQAARTNARYLPGVALPDAVRVTSHLSVAGRTPRTNYYVRALSRAAGRAFGAAKVVTSTPRFIGEIRAAADEDGHVTLAWTEDRFARAPSAGSQAITSAVRSATARIGQPFAAARQVAARRSKFFSTPAVAAAGGRAALAWGLDAVRDALGVQAAIGPAGGPGPPQAVVTKQLQPGYYRSPPAIAVALDPNGTAAVLYEEPVAGPNGPVMTRLMAAEGS